MLTRQLVIPSKLILEIKHGLFELPHIQILLPGDRKLPPRLYIRKSGVAQKEVDLAAYRADLERRNNERG